MRTRRVSLAIATIVLATASLLDAATAEPLEQSTPAPQAEQDRRRTQSRDDRRRDSTRQDESTAQDRESGKKRRPRHPLDIPPAGVVPVMVLPYGYPPPAVSTVVPSGGITFDVSPANTAVYVDGEYTGLAKEFFAGPFFTSKSNPLSLPEGRHRVELRADGYASTIFDVDIVGGSILPYKHGLTVAANQPPSSTLLPPAGFGGMTFDVAPDDVFVYVDSQYVGLALAYPSSSAQPLWLAPGRHRIELQADGYTTMTFNVNIVEGMTTPYRGRLTPAPPSQ